jgi:hypothetical protein
MERDGCSRSGQFAAAIDEPRTVATPGVTARSAAVLQLINITRQWLTAFGWDLETGLTFRVITLGY